MAKECSCGVTISGNKPQCLLCAETGRPPMSPGEKISYVGTQVHQILEGDLEFIDCPYCGQRGKVGPDKKMCCETLAKCVIALLHQIECQERVDLAAKIAQSI